MRCIYLTLVLTFFSFQVLASKQFEDMSLEQLMNVSITGASKYEQKQSEVAAAVTVITRNDIRAYGWRTLSEILTSLPGVFATYDFSYNYIGVRGFNVLGDFNTRILVSINGNRINDATYDQGPMGRDFPLDVDLIERIEFIPGPGSAVYGQNAMLGVVNIITRKGSNVNGVELSGSYQTAEVMPQERATLGKKFDNGVDALVSVSGVQARGENLFFDFRDAAISGVAHHMDGENIKQIFARAEKGPVSFDFIYGNRKKDDPTAIYFSDPLISGQYLKDRRLNSQLQYNDNFVNDTLNVLGRLFIGKYDYDSPLVYEGQKTLSTGPSFWHGAELRLVSSAITNHKLMTGVEYQNNTHIKQTFEYLESPADNITVRSSVVRTGVYLQDEWRITDTLSSTLGVRYDYNNWIGNRLSPRGALIWQATPKAAFKAIYGRAHRSPNSYERDYGDGVSQISNPGLRGETIDAAELVADYFPEPNLNLRASLYAWDVYNIIALGFNPLLEASQYQQTHDKVRARGVELYFDKTWNWGARLRSSLGIQDASQKGSHIPNSPQLLGKINVLVPIPLMSGLKGGYELQYFGERKTLNGPNTDSYFLSNLNLMTDIRWVKGLEASLAVYNLFNEHYLHPVSDSSWHNSLLQPGRTVRFRLEYRF
ncbi:MAG: TonB-dependent receptor [Nitrosomonas sp.]|nr:MAG: TonB-dependent receptor [Nitrosomonas sp.]